MRQIICTSLLVVMFLSLTINVVKAQQSGPYPTLNIDGIPMHCTDQFGFPVPILLDPTLNDIGVARPQPPLIILNPVVMGQYSPIVQQWWFAHECAHVAFPAQFGENPEVKADCIAAKILVSLRILRFENQIIQFWNELSHLSGSWRGHLPGPQRVRLIEACAKNLPY